MKFLLVVSLMMMVAACASRSGSRKAYPDYVKDVVSLTKEKVELKKCRRPQSDELSWQEELREANACWKTSQWDLLELWGQKLIAEHPQSPWGMYYLSVVESQRSNFPLALWMIERSLKLAPEAAVLTLQKGQIYWLQGDENTAVELVQRAISQDRSLVEGYLFLGKISLRNLQKDQAVAFFEKALNAEPGNKEAAQWLHQLDKPLPVVVGQQPAINSHGGQR